MNDRADTLFTHVLREISQRTWIQSTCIKCGAANLGSWLDDALEKWEAAHSLQHREALVPDFIAG